MNYNGIIEKYDPSKDWDLKGGAVKINDRLYQVTSHGGYALTIHITSEEDFSMIQKEFMFVHEKGLTGYKKDYVKDFKFFKDRPGRLINAFVTSIDVDGKNADIRFDHFEIYQEDPLVYFTPEEMTYLKSLKVVNKFNL